MIPPGPEHWQFERRRKKQHLEFVPAGRKCLECGRWIGPDACCHYCGTVREFWHLCEKQNPGLGREFCILVGSLVAGMDEAFVKQMNLGRRVTQDQFERAVDLASRYMKSMGYVLP